MPKTSEQSVVARESQHTKLPWHVSGGHAEYVEAANRLRVADCQVPQKPFMAVGTREMEANAEFIVRACNAHTSLVEALQSILNCFQPLARSAHEVYGTRTFHEEITAAEQALRLAQGEK